jgi:hypothetical protein
VGSALLVALLAIARWDMIWRDPGRLPMTTTMKVATSRHLGRVGIPR